MPDHVGIRGTGKAYFLDSGTWRTRIDAGTTQAKRHSGAAADSAHASQGG